MTDKGVIKKICCILASVVIFSGVTGNVYADTQEQKALKDIDVDITWYDLGKGYTNYYIQDDLGTGIYMLNMSDNTDGPGKTAFVNGKGEIVLKPETYDGYSSSSSGDDTITLMQKGNQYYYIDSNGIREIDGKEYKDIGPFIGGYATVTIASNAHKGVIDTNGKLVFEDKEGKYKDFEYIGKGILSGAIDDRSYTLLDISGKTLSNTSYNYISSVSEDMIKVLKDEKCGFMDLSGKEVIPLIYDQAAYFSDGLAAVYKDSKWGFIDKTGKEIISPIYDDAWSFNNGFAIVSQNNKWGLINKAGNIIIPIQYDRIVENEKESGLFDAQKNNKSFLMNSSGEVIRTKDYSYYTVESSNRTYVEKIAHNLQVSGYLDKDENLLTGFKEFNLIYLSDSLYLGAKSGEYPPGVAPPHDYDQRFALLDSKGNNLTGFKYSNIGDFFNNFQVVYKYYYDEVGLINQYGAEVLPTVFDEILLTDEGYAFVCINDSDSGANGRVGYFKIPDNFSEKKGVKPITVYLDGIELYFDSEPVIKNQRTMIPMRKIFESLGADVKWDNKTKTASASINGKEVSVSIGSQTAYVNGSKAQLEMAPFMQSDITLVPLRFVSENLGADVKWDGEARRVIINSQNNQ